MKYCFYFLICLLACGCAHDDYRRSEGAVWGTTFHIIYKSPANLADSILAEMSRVERSLSMFDPASTVSRINSGATDSIDSYFAAVMAVSQRVWRASGGAFDPTVAPLTDLWGFGRKGSDTPAPDSASVASALARVGLGKASVKEMKMVKPDGMEFDFSAVAKGFGVDCVAAVLRRNGCRDYMVEIGGEVSVSGVNPSGEPWHIMIERPEMTHGAVTQGVATLEITDCAIATSGNYRNYRAVGDSVTVGHTIDPRTGYPRQREVLSVSVVAPSCALADALATALMASPRADAAGIISRFPATRALLCIASTDSIATEWVE